jgi:hypothetical protein
VGEFEQFAAFLNCWLGLVVIREKRSALITEKRNTKFG